MSKDTTKKQKMPEGRMQRLIRDRMMRNPAVVDRHITRTTLRRLIDEPPTINERED